MRESIGGLADNIRFDIQANTVYRFGLTLKRRVGNTPPLVQEKR